MFSKKHPLEEKLISIVDYKNADKNDLSSLTKCIEEIKNYKGCRRKPCLDVQQQKENETPLILAALYGSLEMLITLIEAEANLDIQDLFGRTALLCAIDNSAKVTALILAGANPNIYTYDDCTPLMVAAFRGIINTVRFLIRAKANIAFARPTGETALDGCIQGASHYFWHDPKDFSHDRYFIAIACLLLKEGIEITNSNSFIVFLDDYSTASCFLEDVYFCLSILCERQTIKREAKEALNENDLDDEGFAKAEDSFYKLPKPSGKYYQSKKGNVIEKIDEATGKCIPLDVVKLISDYDNPYRHQLFKIQKAYHQYHQEVNKEKDIESKSICRI